APLLLPLRLALGQLLLVDLLLLRRGVFRHGVRLGRQVENEAAGADDEVTGHDDEGRDRDDAQADAGLAPVLAERPLAALLAVVFDLLAEVLFEQALLGPAVLVFLFRRLLGDDAVLLRPVVVVVRRPAGGRLLPRRRRPGRRGGEHLLTGRTLDALAEQRL